MTTLVFDVYGTLIDTNGVEDALQEIFAEDASAISKIWREKQLEYSFRRGLMNQYQDFSICTRDALKYACTVMNKTLTEPQKNALLSAYRTLPAFADVVPALQSLSGAGLPLFAFSNGLYDDVNNLLHHADIAQYFDGVISVDEIKTFKPNPAVYQHLLTRCQSSAESSWLISGNPFDVIGAVSAGLKGIWLQRSSAAIFDPWEDYAPTLTIKSLTELDNATG